MRRLGYDDAIVLFKDAYSTDRSVSLYGTERSRAYHLRGQRNVMLGQFNDAVVDLKKAYSLDPTNASISANLSAAYQQSIAT